MGRSISINTKGRGRPRTTGTGHLVGVRLLEDRLAAIDAWIAAQPEPKPSRPEAIRHLVELGLAVKPTARKSGAERAAAAEHAEAYASDEIDRQQHGLAQTSGEKTSRKRRLLKGPPEFQPTAKRK